MLKKIQSFILSDPKKVFKFLVSGGLAAIVEYVTFILTVHAIQVIFANAISFLCGLIVSFTLNKYWVFRSDKSANEEFIRYFILATINLTISTIFITILVNSAHVVPFIAKLIMMILIAAWNYFIFAKLIFKN